MRTKLLPPEFLDAMAGVLKTLGHGYRLRIVEFLDLRGPTPAHRLLKALGGAQGAMSQHLARLCQAGVIRADRRGREVWYTLAAPAAVTLLRCMRQRLQPGGKPSTRGPQTGRRRRLPAGKQVVKTGAER